MRFSKQRFKKHTLNSCKKYLEEIECNEHMDDGFLKKILKERVDDLG